MNRLEVACRQSFPSGFQLDVDFATESRLTALFGPSGSGKSTTLSVIAGLRGVAQAKVRLDDVVFEDTAARTVLTPAERRVGYVLQDFLLFPHLSVEGNLRYGLRRRARDSAQIEFARAVDVLELGPLLQRFPRNLSGGESQRVALGRALLSGPRLLLLDEPLAALDAELRSRVLNYLERIVAEWNIPTLFVTHGQAEVRRLAEYVIVMSAGRVIATGTPEEALGQPRSLDMRNSAGPVNLLRISELRQEAGHTLGRVGTQWLQLPQSLTARQSPTYVRFTPYEVTLAQHDVDGLSIRNQLRGEVRQAIKLDGRVFVAIDVGQPIWSEITSDAARELRLDVGSPVVCLIKTQSLRPVE